MAEGKTLVSDLNSDSPTAVLFARVYDELRRIAQGVMIGERNGHTLSATALVNETYLRLNKSTHWETSGHFFSAAVETMRRILVDHARKRAAVKRSGKREHCDLENVARQQAAQDLDALLDLDSLLDQLAKVDRDAARFVTLRLFAGMSVVQAGAQLGLTKHSAYQLWNFCQAWFAARAACDGSE